MSIYRNRVTNLIIHFGGLPDITRWPKAATAARSLVLELGEPSRATNLIIYWIQSDLRVRRVDIWPQVET